MTNVLIVSRARIHRKGFSSTLENADGIKVVGACGGEEAPGNARTKKPDVVLVDVLARPDPAVIGSILEAWPHGKIIAVGVGEEDRDILFWMEHGASHFVAAEAERSDLLSAIAEVASGEIHWPTRISTLFLRRMQELVKTDPAQSSMPRLTPRQREILHFIGEGDSAKEIAAKLSIEPSTVKNHVHRILQKAHVHSRFDALARFNAELCFRKKM